MTIAAMELFGLKDRHVLITGAGGGIGRALVATFQAAGARVSGADRDSSLLEGLDLVHRLTFDLTDPTSVTREMGRLDEADAMPEVLISNAGFTRADMLDQVDTAAWDNELAINLTGAFHVATPVVAAMARRGGGAIVFIASVNALAHYGNPAYSAAKAGLIAYAKALAVERGAVGIRANVICPGSVRTPAWDHRFERQPGLAAQVLPHYPLGRLVAADEVARAALFLASPAASGITGAVLPVDAGLTAGNYRFVKDVIEGSA
ncbi:SDR family oxidoreductase [Lichenihabitans sp. PAMC28606]|uniref:SDR family oxidoreductase n=1 Tax=Lichenihabitans sp. PAMC28606 TaxID=2880932 RepID=UPI001D0B370A|nr:SDR family oxidoreductase [Lichenihabitans sp. PAMC28606]UDL94461.1 SDR family oxidoreductase [Lichenihabitans sp. PAMC28606]